MLRINEGISLEKQLGSMLIQLNESLDEVQRLGSREKKVAKYNEFMLEMIKPMEAELATLIPEARAEKQIKADVLYTMSLFYHEKWKCLSKFSARKKEVREEIQEFNAEKNIFNTWLDEALHFYKNEAPKSKKNRKAQREIRSLRSKSNRDIDSLINRTTLLPELPSSTRLTRELVIPIENEVKENQSLVDAIADEPSPRERSASTAFIVEELTSRNNEEKRVQPSEVLVQQIIPSVAISEEKKEINEISELKKELVSLKALLKQQGNRLKQIEHNVAQTQAELSNVTKEVQRRNAAEETWGAVLMDEPPAKRWRY